MINFEAFKKVFLNGVTDKNGNYKEYFCNRDFTQKVEKSMRELAAECQMDYYPEYYKVDYTFWENNNEVVSAQESKYGMRYYNWNLVALIEHENNENDWHYEVQKLAPFSCKLRIVIGYRDGIHSDKERLGYVAGLLSKMADQECFCNKGDFWIVIGNSGHNEAGYKFYKYNANDNCFEEQYV